MKLQVSTNAFQPGTEIPQKFTCSGEDLSPEISWTDLPEGTQSVAVIVDDPDAPVGTWTHWMVYDLPPSIQKLAQERPRTASLDDGGLQGKNDFGNLGYNGPCPPPGKPHRYFFKVYALDQKLEIPAGATRKALDEALKGHVLAEGEVMGTFARSR